jgi:hypothetical protein
MARGQGCVESGRTTMNHFSEVQQTKPAVIKCPGREHRGYCDAACSDQAQATDRCAATRSSKVSMIFLTKRCSVLLSL